MHSRASLSSAVSPFLRRIVEPRALCGPRRVVGEGFDLPGHYPLDEVGVDDQSILVDALLVTLMNEVHSFEFRDEHLGNVVDAITLLRRYFLRGEGPFVSIAVKMVRRMDMFSKEIDLSSERKHTAACLPQSHG